MSAAEAAERALRNTRVIDDIVAVVRTGQRFVVTGHMNPDGDVLGCMSSMAGVLRSLGKDVVVYNRDPAPERYAFLPYLDELVHELPTDAPIDAVFILDCADPERVAPGFREAVGGAMLVCLDHHAGSVEAVDLGLHDPTAPAVGVLVAWLAKALGVRLDAQSGQGIYTSIVTDTGSFRYSNTNEEAHAVASELLGLGVDGHGISVELYEKDSLPRVKILGEALSALELRYEGRLAWMVLDSAVFERSGASPSDEDGAVDYGRTVRGVEVSCLVRQGARPGLFRVSMRSRGDVDVESIATALGGGGHRHAAGCQLPAPSLDEAVARVERALAEVFEGRR